MGRIMNPMEIIPNHIPNNSRNSIADSEINQSYEQANWKQRRGQQRYASKSNLNNFHGLQSLLKHIANSWTKRVNT